MDDLVRAMMAPFDEGRKSAPSTLFIDEFGSFYSRQGNTQHRDWWVNVVVGPFQLLDGVEMRDGVVVVVAANHRDLVDPAVMRGGRLDRTLEIARLIKTGLAGIRQSLSTRGWRSSNITVIAVRKEMAHAGLAPTVAQILHPRNLKLPIMHERPPKADERKSAEPVALAALFIAFLKVSLCSFGGGLVWARRITVEQRLWISEEEFADILSLCQFMPGPNVVGIAVCVGAKLRGLIGAIAAVSGFVLIPWAVGFSLGVVYLRNTHFAVLQHIFGGISAAAAGLLIATGIRMLIPHRSRVQALVFASLAVGGMVFTKLPLHAVLFSLTPLSIAVAGIGNARTQ